MSVTFEGALLPARRLYFKARVAVATRRANLDVETAFDIGRGMITRRMGLAAGMGVIMVLAFSLISYAVTYPPPAGIRIPDAAPTHPPAALPEKTAITNKPIAAVEAPSVLAPSSEEAAGKEAMTALAPPLIPETGNEFFKNLPALSYYPPEQKTGAPYVLAVDKTRKELLILEDGGPAYKIIKRYPASIGARKGDKWKSGDRKTPEGLYHIVAIKEGRGLPAEYGPRAFVLDYPNELDAVMKKTGDGIWIHGSGLGEATRETKGCVEINDFNIADLGRFADMGTPVYIFPEGFKLPMAEGAIAKNIITPAVVYGLKEMYAVAPEEGLEETALAPAAQGPGGS